MRLMEEGELFCPNIYYASFVTSQRLTGRRFWISRHLGKYCWEDDVYFKGTKITLFESLPATVFTFMLTDDEVIEHVVLETI